MLLHQKIQNHNSSIEVSYVIPGWDNFSGLLRKKNYNYLCKLSEDGFAVFAAHPEDCSKFIMCDRLRGFEMQCPAGTLFDVNLKICNHAYVVKCEKPEETPTEQITTPKKPVTETTPVIPTISDIPENIDISENPEPMTTPMVTPSTIETTPSSSIQGTNTPKPDQFDEQSNCSDFDSEGYSCVSTGTCLATSLSIRGEGFAEYEDLAREEAENARCPQAEAVCCHTKNIQTEVPDPTTAKPKEPEEPLEQSDCSEFASESYSCVPTETCLTTFLTIRGGGDFENELREEAENSRCPSARDQAKTVCCHSKNIIQPIDCSTLPMKFYSFSGKPASTTGK